MLKFLKIFRILLIVILSIIIFLTIYFIIDRYVFSPNMKGISPVDIKDILKYIVLPLLLTIVVIKYIEKAVRK